MSSFQMEIDFNKPVRPRPATSIPYFILNTHQKLPSKLNLSLIINSNATYELPVSTVGMFQHYMNTGMNKRGTSSQPNIVLAINHDAMTVLLTVNSVKRIPVAFEDFLISLQD